MRTRHDAKQPLAVNAPPHNGPYSPIRWQLTREVGLTHGSGTPRQLRFPTIVEGTACGTCLIVDHRAPLNRLLEVDRDARVVWSYAGPRHIAGAQRLPEQRTLVVDAVNRTALIVDGGSRVIERRRLQMRAKPSAARMLDDQTIVTASAVGIERFDDRGRCVHRLPVAPGVIKHPYDFQLLDGGRILVTDPEAHRVAEFDARGALLWSYGTWECPGNGKNQLLSPRSAWRLADGMTIISEARAHRLLEVDSHGMVSRRIEPRRDGWGYTGPLTAPGAVRELSGGTLLVADVGGMRVVELSRSGETLWTFGGGGVARRLFSFPRMSRPLGHDCLLVCDSYHDRIVELDATGAAVWAFGSREDRGHGSGIAVPRAVDRDAQGQTIIADGMNGRLVFVGADGRIERELLGFRRGGSSRTRAFEDPHHVRAHRGGILVVDSDLGAVLLIDDAGHLVRSWREAAGMAFRDPHHAALLPDGSLLIADSGNHRIVRMDKNGLCVAAVSAIPPDGNCSSTLAYPRSVTVDGALCVVLDSDNGRVLAFDRHHRACGGYGPVLEVAPQLTACNPEIRWAKHVALDSRRAHVLTDYASSRVLVLERLPEEGPKQAASAPQETYSWEERLT